MFRRDEQLTPFDKVSSDYFVHKPSAKQSIYDNFSFGIIEPRYHLASLDAEFRQSPRGQQLKAQYEALKLGNQNDEVGWIQWSANEVSNMLGQSLDPTMWMLAEVGGAAATKIASTAARFAPESLSVLAIKPIAELMGEPASKYIPNWIGKEGKENTLSMALFGKEWAKGFGIGAGVTLPSSVHEAFDEEHGTFDILSMAKSMGAGGAFGLVLSNIPFGFGILKANYNRAKGRPFNFPVSKAEINDAFDKGIIDQKTFDLWNDVEEYRANPKSHAELREKVKSGMTEYLNKQGIEVDTANHEVSAPIMDQESVKLMQLSSIDQLVGDYMPEQYGTHLSDFSVQKSIDEVRANTKMIDGLRGYVEYAESNMIKRESIMKRANQILEDTFKLPIKNDFIYSQKGIYDYMKKGQMERSHIENLPLTIPENVRKNAVIKEKINKLESKLSKERRKGQPENKQTRRRIQELEKSYHKILTPREEMDFLKSKLIQDGKLIDKISLSPHYFRLQELSDVWQPAKTLLDLIHLEENMNRQQGFLDLAKQVLEMADAPIGKVAKQENVTEYLQQRTEPTLSSEKTTKELNKQVEKEHKVPTDSDTIIIEQDRIVEKSTNKNSKKEYESARDKVVEFKQSENVFKRLIDCVLGAAS